jgi:hypothetical protein
MKWKYLFPLLSVVFLYSCKKENSKTSSHFSFKTNTAQHNWGYDRIGPSRGANIIKASIPLSGYLLQAWDKSQGIAINLHFNTPTLTTGTFKVVTTSVSIVTQSSYIINAITYAPLQIGDSVSVTISNLNNKHANGSFVATMHDISTPTNKMEISDGSFENVQILE